MKKMLALAAVLAAFAASAAITTSAFRAVVATPPASVAAGATATNTVAVAGYTGLGEVCYVCNGLAAANSNRTVTVYIDGTNTVEGGWYLIGAASYKGAPAGVVRVPFRADTLPPTVRMRVANTTAASIVGGVLLAR